ncbi:MAG: N-acetyl-gamma-glutamyl-phosphate reductase [Candidatus Omnitrophica bacterium]|nr:N-acetyl-gamma-glutamyl-phosphate reductase [Candidatus Omnitrophota bacterium]
MARVKVIGVAGYSGSELARLLIQHPNVESILLIDRRAEEPTPIWKYRANLRGTTDQMVVGKDDGSKADAVFFATPDGVTMNHAKVHLETGAKVIDFSGDTRLRSAEIHYKWYGIEHASPNLLQEAVYGLPELHREELRKANVIANPGCYPTATILGFAPMVKKGWIDTSFLVADVKSGVSGAGKHLNTRMHFAECEANFNAYKVVGHKHTPEIEQELSLLAGEDLTVNFIPHLLPVTRGILATLYSTLTEDLSVDQIQAEYESFYESHPFVRVLPQGEEACLKAVQGSNFLDISVHVDSRNSRLIVTVTEDNLVKGASGQAVQNMNLALGFEETAGLMQPGLWL